MGVRRAAEVSRYVHVKYTGRKYKRVIALLDEHLNDLWVGGKASYRLGPVIEEGGELIIYAPHLTCISDTHGALIQRYGYVPLEKIPELVGQSPELQQNLRSSSSSARQLRGTQACERHDRATVCHHIGIGCRRGYLPSGQPGLHKSSETPAGDYEGDTDTRIVKQAGRDLYLVRPLEA